MAYYPGDTITETLPLDTTGQTFTTVYSTDPNGNTWAPTITEPETTIYEFEFVVNSVGTWTWIGTSSIDLEEVTISVDVDTALDTDDDTTISSLSTTTLMQARRDIQDLLGDLVVLSLTADGDTSTAFDSQNLFDSDNAWRGSHIYVVSAASSPNVGRVAVVDSSSHEQGVLSFSPPLPQATTTSDVLDLHNLQGVGWTRTEIVRRINAALVDTFPKTLVPRIESISAAFDRDTGEVVIPEGFTHIHTLQYEYPDDEWNSIPRTNWHAERANQTIYVDGHSRWNANNRSLRIRGFGRHPTISAEYDLIYLNPRWLTLHVASQLAMQRAHTREQRSWAIEWKREADEKRLLMQTALPPNTVRIR
jgi:hypothetical protein